MNKQLREQLTTDPFASQVGQSIGYVRENRKRAGLVLGVGLGAILLGFAGWAYRGKQYQVRQAELTEAIRAQDAQVGQGGTEFVKVFATQADKDKTVRKEFTDVIQKFPGSEEAAIAHYYLGVTASDGGDLAEAEKELRVTADSGYAAYASQAKFALAQIYRSQGKLADAEKLLRDIMANPTILVSKEQATIALARMIGPKNPAEARKLLEPLRSERSAVSRAALTALAELPR